MNIRTPQPTQAARLLKSYFSGQGIAVTHSQALEAVARLHGYQDWQAMKADIRFADAPALVPVSSNEYELRDKEHSAWIGVDNISVCVTRNDEGVSVDLYAKGREDDSLAGTCLFFEEARTEPEDEVPSEASFDPTPVDWRRVAEFEELSHVRINGGPVLELTFISRTGLGLLDDLQDLSSHVRLARSAGFSYASVDGTEVAIPLGVLQKAVEHEPGVIDLIDGRRLELLVQNDSAGYGRVSPAGDTLVPLK